MANYTSENKAAMSKAAIDARRQYMRDWEAKNKEKRAAYRAAYWERKAALAERGVNNG